jgi:hypothetical protein
MDLAGYEKFMNKELVEYHLPEDKLKESLQSIENLPKP